MPTFTVVAGPNGAGKSTLTRLGREGFQASAVLDPDAVARALQATSESGGSLIDAGRAVLEMADQLLSARQSFLVETTLSGNTYLKMMSRAKAAGYRVQLLYVGTENVDINLQRVLQRVRKGGHDVPEEDQRRRYPRSLANLERALALADEAILFDNSTMYGPPCDCKGKFGREDKSAQMYSAFEWRLVLLARMSCARVGPYKSHGR